MSIRNLLRICVLLLLLAGCSGDDDNDVINPISIIGDWEASHQSKNPQYGDTGDMWNFTFNLDGTGSGLYATNTFKYEILGNHITLNLMNTEFYYGQTVFEYKIVSFSKDRMEWDEIPHDGQDNSMYLKFYRIANAIFVNR